MSKAKTRLPHITNIMGTTQSLRRPTRQSEAGTTVRVTGSGFGDDPGQVRFLFDEIEASPFLLPFSSDALLVTCPLPPKSTSYLRIRVGKKLSNRVKFRVIRPGRPRRPLGSATAEFFQSVDHAAALVAALARRTAPATSMKSELLEAAAGLDAGRRITQRGVELLMQSQELQNGVKSELPRTIAILDEMVTKARFTAQVDTFMINTFGPGSLISKAIGVNAAEFLFETGSLGDIGKSLTSIAVPLGFLINQFVKSLEASEAFLKMVKPAAKAGAGYSIELSGAGTLYPGEGISGIAKGIDRISQLLVFLGKSADRAELIGKFDGIKPSIDFLKAEADKLINAIEELGQKLDRQEEKLDTLEVKADSQEQKLDLIIPNIL